ncbi:protein O-mannosyl-transferase TMTC1 isoform X2 [Ascaphus truei]|uniref:protein O-mannosyl-transferase TMTC1 isoform X2 n=1 Tax=Ascaphus truei TaxID=8439 RepID=UPI003F59FC23
MNRVERIPREIPWDRANGAGQCASGEIPRDTTSSVGQNISGEIPRDRDNGAGQCTSGEIPRDRANGAGQRTPGEIPRDRDNGAGHRTPGEIPRDRDNGLGQRTPGEIPRDRANGLGQSTLGDIYRDRANGNGQSTPEEMPRDRANGVGQSISGEIPSDTANGAGQSFLGDIPSDTAYGAGQSILRGRYQDDSHSGRFRRLQDPPQNLAAGWEWLGPQALAAPVVLAAACFARSLFGEFVHDDVWAILNNPDSLGETPLRSVFSNDFWGKAMSDSSSHKSYRPLCVLTFRINVLLGGLDPFYFHAVNVGLHCMASSLLMYTCNKAVFDDRRLAMAAALLFSVHPIHTEAVAGIVGRADVLSCLLFLLAFLSYIRSVELGPARDIFPPTASPLFLLLSLVLGTCAMLVKETGCTVFGVCLLYDLLFLCPRRLKRSLTPDQHRSIRHVAGPFLKRAALVTCHVALVLYFRLRIMGGSMPLFSEQDNPASVSPYILTRFLTYSYLLAFNVWLLLAPITLCYDWQVGSIPLIHSIWDRRNVATLLLLGILISLGMHCLTASKRLEHRELLVGLLFLIFPFIPASNLFFRVGFVVAERVLYMPSMGFCILCVHGLKVLYSRCGPRGTSALTLCFLLLLLLFSCKSVSQSECWRSREVLFRSGVQALPHNAKVHYNFANFLKDQNRRDEAIHHYKTVLRLYPQHPSALNNLGTLTHNATAAEEYYRRALVISSQHSRALFNLGNLLKTQGRDDEAERLLRESLVHGPFLADAYSSLGSLLADQKRHKEAGDVYQTGIRSCPENPDLHNNYGVFLVDMGAPQEAMSHYLITLRLRPDHHVAMLNLGRLHRSLDQNTEAETWYKRALQFSRDKDVLCPLGALYYNTGRYEESLRLYQEAVALNPGSVQIRLSLAQVLAVAGHPKEAESLARRVTDEVTDCFECFRLLSAIYSKEENYAKALEMIDYALQMKPKDPKVTSELHFARGNQLRELNQLEEAFKGDYISARTFYKKASQLDPNSKLLKENLAKLQRLENRLQGTKGRDPEPLREQLGNPREVQKDPREPQRNLREPQRNPREEQKDQREPQGSPREQQGSPREPQGNPRKVQGNPREVQGNPREQQRD